MHQPILRDKLQIVGKAIQPKKVKGKTKRKKKKKSKTVESAASIAETADNDQYCGTDDAQNGTVEDAGEDEAKQSDADTDAGLDGVEDDDANSSDVVDDADE